MTNRREFLQTSAAITGSLFFPKSVFATSASSFHFIHADSCNHWPVLDPVQWSIEHAHEVILARAAEGLSKLTESDGDRIIRLVIRRCSLNLLEVQGNQVHVQFWGQQGLADLKPFFKSHGLARPEIKVMLRDRKKKTVTTQHGDDFLYGVPIASDFDRERFQSKWQKRLLNESDDLEAAPGTSSGFAWDGLPDGSIPWAAMRSAWRRAAPGICLNCSGETISVNFGLRQVGMFNRSEFFEHVCGACRRSFKDEAVDVKAWMAANLEKAVLPSDELVSGRRVARKTKAHT